MYKNNPETHQNISGELALSSELRSLIVELCSKCNGNFNKTTPTLCGHHCVWIINEFVMELAMSVAGTYMVNSLALENSHFKTIRWLPKSKTPHGVTRPELFDIRNSNNSLKNIRDGFSSHCRHNGQDGVSGHQPHRSLLNRLFRCRSKKTSKLRVTGICVGNSPVTGEFPVQMASNAENISISWRHHGSLINTPPLTIY